MIKDYKLLYDQLKYEFEAYKDIKHKEIDELKEHNVELQKQVGIFYNVIEVSKYINSNLRDEKIISMINDMIIGLLGVTNSHIYMINNCSIKEKEYSINNDENLSIEEEDKVRAGEAFLINSEFIRKYNNSNQIVRSSLGMPIKIRKNHIGYIIVEHTIEGYLTEEHRVFLSSISNQIAIALENAILYRGLKQAVIKDPLLSIYNRKYFFECCREQIQDFNEKYAIVMIDLDNFKKVNDTYGHQFGDEVLIQTCNVIKKNLAKGSIFARYGGEELIVFMKAFNSSIEVFDRIEIIRKAIEENNIVMKEINKKITASFGIAFYPMDGKNIKDVISIADELLYKAKERGKNKVVMNDIIKI